MFRKKVALVLMAALTATSMLAVPARAEEVSDASAETVDYDADAGEEKNVSTQAEEEADQKDISKAKASLCVNEVCAEEDENGALKKANPVKGGYCDWVEIYNKGDEAVSASGLYLTDSIKKAANYKKYAMPDVEIEAHGYLVIACAKDVTPESDQDYIAQFGIKAGDTVYLTDGTEVVDSLEVEASETNKTTARYPDGEDVVGLTDATPGATNIYKVKAPVLSQTTGFYDPFELTIQANEGLTVYYTLDGTDPTTKSNVYTEPIQIEDASSNANVYSARTDTSTLFKSSLVKKYGMSSYLMKAPASKVDKATRLKAVCVDQDGNMSDVVSATYFVGLKDQEEYKDVKIVSLQASDDDLFGKNGIYVLGSKYNGKTKLPGTSLKAMRFKGNYSYDSEITGTATYFKNTDATPKEETVSLSIKGFLSRCFPQKSWNVKGDDLSFTLETDGLNNAYKLKDPVAMKLAEGLNIDHSNLSPCEVFLNGEYWGVYSKGDRMFSKSYYADKYDVDKSSIAIIKQGSLNEGTAQDKADYDAMMKFVKSNDMRIGKNYKYLTDRMDIDSMIDYYCTELFIRNRDWRPTWNYGMWRSSEYNDGKWRYILWDLNSPTCYSGASSNMFSFVFTKDAFFKSVYKNAEFRNKFNARFKELLGSNFSYENSSQVLNSVYTEMTPYVKANMERFYNGNKKNMNTFASSKSSMDSFLKSRVAYCQKHINSTAGNKSYTKAGTSGLSASLSKTSYQADSTAKEPTVTVKKGKTVLEQGVDYEVSYSNNIEPGTAKVTITMTGGFTGTMTKTFKIKK